MSVLRDELTRLQKAAADLGADLETTEGRQLVCAREPMFFALIYLINHLTDVEGTVSLCAAHTDWSEFATTFIDKKINDRSRNAFIAPRDCGKSTWWFLILPMWAAAYGYSQFVAAFADSGTQAETHLRTFTTELQTNELLREDFPRLCNPAKRTTGFSEADNASMFMSDSRFVFTARGIDASVLGLKVGKARPDLIIFDDIEPDESNYSTYQAAKRLTTVTDTIMPMNTRARVVMVGTVTMPGSITHQLVQHHLHSSDEDPEWIKDEGVIPHYYPAIIIDDEGDEHSLWPEKWPLPWLMAQRHTRSFAKNFMNLPISLDGDYWNEADFRYGEAIAATRTIIAIDPAVTTKKKSDYTGVAVISYSPVLKKCYVREVLQLKLSNDRLRARVLQLLESADYVVGGILIESNQGGDTWLSVFHNMPCRVRFRFNSEKKEVRAVELLNYYQRRVVLHTKPIHALQEQMLAYPNVLRDDMIDAVGIGVKYFMQRRKTTQPGGTAVKYE